VTSADLPPFELAVGICVRPLPGEVEAGDAGAAFAARSGVVVALVDGLGHGPRAALAARMFLKSVGRNVDEPLEELFACAHKEMIGSRGAVAAVAHIDVERRHLYAGGVGNIAAAVVRAGGRARPVLMTPGVLGSALPRVRMQGLALSEGDALVMCSDGIRARCKLDPLHDEPAQATAERLVRLAASPADDAACLVVRVLRSGALRSAPEPAPPPMLAIQGDST
jgi:hypothetical protein